MKLKEKAKVLDKEGIAKALERLAHEIIEQRPSTGRLAIVGVKNRGAYLGRRIAALIARITGTEPPVGELDITLYRDDLTQVAEQPVVGATEIEFDITAKEIVLVDDVLYTGRTIRCALDALIDFGRPAKIELAVLIDRGHRELPIRADYVGKNIPTSPQETVDVRLEETDGKDEAVVCEKVP